VLPSSQTRHARRSHDRLALRINQNERRSEEQRSAIHVLRLILLQSIITLAGGIAAGAILSIGLMPLLSDLLFGVTPADPTTYSIISAALFAVGALACYIPSRHAMKIEPMLALRHE
jgi:ABC-type antimicrobial peptide transport system permease subunit